MLVVALVALAVSHTVRPMVSSAESPVDGRLAGGDGRQDGKVGLCASTMRVGMVGRLGVGRGRESWSDVHTSVLF